jgi:radical SAM protein with 4Fe4S-binding SPASM domain
MNNIYSDIGNVPDIPLLLEVEPAHGCNLRCIMCHIPTQDNTKPVYLDIDILERRTEGVENCHVIIGSEYEPTIHPQFEKLLKLIIKRNWKVDFLSNGVNLDRVDQGLLAEVPFHVYNASFDGFLEETFADIRVGANYHKVKQNILKVAALAKKNGAFTAINATMLKSNFEETKDLVRMWDAEGFDLVRLLVMQARDISDHVLNESLYVKRYELISTFNDVADMVAEEQLKIGVRSGYYGSPTFCTPKNLHVHQATIYSDNPGFRHVPGVRQDFLAGTWPGMSLPCKSPFVYCRIRWDGTVDLCNKRDYVIGNIYNDSLLDIWHGHHAQGRREKIMLDKIICEYCDYFRFCIGSRQQDYLKKESYFATGVLETQAVVDFIEKSDSMIAGK